MIIPGLACGGDLFTDLATHLANRYEVHVLTLAGFAGVKAEEGDKPLDRARQALARYLRARTTQPVTLIGHSLGAFLGFWLAQTDPDLVARLAALDGVPFLPALFDPNATAASMEGSAKMIRASLAAMTPDQFKAYNQTSLAAMIKNPVLRDRVAMDGGRSDPRTVADAFYEIFTTDLRPRMSQVRAPVLLVAGLGDDSGNAALRAGYEKQLSSDPSARVSFTDRGGHFLVLENPQLVFGLLDEFLAGPAPPRSRPPGG